MADKIIKSNGTIEEANKDLDLYLLLFHFSI